ncbi:Cysteine-rich receptor-like protein kinase 43 [Sarracenia purpurea var. burkii]
MTKPRNFVQNLLRPFRSRTEGKNEEELENIAAQEQNKQFPFETLVSATKDFHPNHKLGEGGFGPVFKGKLDDGRQIAVKKLALSSNQGKKEFTNEAKLLSRVQHRNVVNLLGYCAHGAEMLLVYEYVANESLDKHLFNSEPHNPCPKVVKLLQVKVLTNCNDCKAQRYAHSYCPRDGTVPLYKLGISEDLIESKSSGPKCYSDPL